MLGTMFDCLTMLQNNAFQLFSLDMENKSQIFDHPPMFDSLARALGSDQTIKHCLSASQLCLLLDKNLLDKH